MTSSGGHAGGGRAGRPDGLPWRRPRQGGSAAARPQGARAPDGPPGPVGGGRAARRRDTATPDPDAGAGVQGLASRRVAYRALRRIDETDAWSVPVVNAALARSDLDARDRSFTANLTYQTLRWSGSLDWVLARRSKRPLDSLDRPVLDVLRMGAWQLLFGRVPDSAVVSTAVELARAEIGPHVAGFVNGVLRSIARDLASRGFDGLGWPAATTDAGLGLRLGYPEWMVTEAKHRFGTDRATAVLQAGNEPPGVTFRAVDPDGRDALCDELRAAGAGAEPSALAPEGIRAPGADPGRLQMVAEGRAVVQDEASMLVTRALLGAVARDRPLVFDACAGPGGKTTHLAQAGADVVAADNRPARASMVAGAAAALATGGQRVAVLAADAGRPALRADAFDGVLLDAPCTGLGVLRRRPELRWRRVDSDPRDLGELQLSLLIGMLDLVKPGGIVCYSVCTWTHAETAAVARRVLTVAGDRVAVEPIAAGAGEHLGSDPGVQLSPDTDGTDGMYLLLLRRTG